MTQHGRITGRERLIRNGGLVPNRRARRLCLEALEAALAAVDPARSVASKLRLARGRILVDGISVKIPRRIVAIAVGKASVAMLTAAMRILGRHVESAILVAPKTEKIGGLDTRIAPFRTGHPIPDEEGISASRHVIESIEQMHRDDLLLCLISGGASAMLPAPANGISLDDKKQITERLIRSRASIHEVNTVRRHLSKLKGGGLVKLCGAGHVISLIISDVPGDTLPDIASGLTAPDPTTFQDAVHVLKEFDVWTKAPGNVKKRFMEGLAGRIPDTPKPGDDIFRKVHNIIIANNRSACEAMKKNLDRMATPTMVLTSSLNMEARSLGKLLASIAKDSETLGRPLKRPSALVLGGETTVDVKGEGMGGRNQEVAIAALNGIGGLRGVGIATLGTDGIDGHSPAAGAIVDGESMARASRMGLQIRKYMAENDSFNFFRKLGDGIITGRTGTNVCDVCVLVRTQ